MINNRGTNAHLIALYTRADVTISMERFLLATEALLASYDLEMNWMGVDGKGFGDKLTKVKRRRKKLFETQFEGIHGLDFMVIPAASDAPAFDHFVYIHAGYSDFKNEFSFSIEMDEQILTLAEMGNQIRTTYDFIGEMEYGFGYTMDYKDGPSLYSWGAGNGNQTEEEENQRTKWSHYQFKDNCFQTGLIRDVYEVNYLNRNHLGYPLRTTAQRAWYKPFAPSSQPLSLHRFLVESEIYGIPEKISDYLWQWNPPQDQIEDIRKILDKNDILIAYL